VLGTVDGVSPARVTIVSDTHLSLSAPEANTNWDAVVQHVESKQPDVVIHVGDLSLDGSNHADDLRHARSQLDRLPVAWYAVPGNHDVGDNVSAGSPEESVTTERTERWLDIIGADLWSLELNGWTVLALNAQLFGSGLDAEAAQWSWLEDRLGALGPQDPIAIITHKPITAGDTELATAPAFRFIPSEARSRLGDLFADRRVRLVVSGHVHQYRILDLDGTRHLWAPTTWSVLPDNIQSTIGVKRCGIVTLELGDGAVEPKLVEPAGIEQLTAFVNVPDRYAHLH
jgi:3',5'-cyclic-AMP phosphodiesterase